MWRCFLYEKGKMKGSSGDCFIGRMEHMKEEGGGGSNFMMIGSDGVS
jgi:hypothetical protein